MCPGRRYFGKTRRADAARGGGASGRDAVSRRGGRWDEEQEKNGMFEGERGRQRETREQEEEEEENQHRRRADVGRKRTKLNKRTRGIRQEKKRISIHE